MSLEQNNTKVNLSAEDEATLYELQQNAVEGVLALFGDSYASLSDADREAVTVELGREFYAHSHYLDEITNEFEKERSLKFYLDRIAAKKEFVESAPLDLREHLTGESVTNVLAVKNFLAKDGDWEVYRHYLERAAERNKTGTTWQELPFISTVRYYFTDEEIESVLTYNGKLLDAWKREVFLAYDIDRNRFFFADPDDGIEGLRINDIYNRDTSGVWEMIIVALAQCHNEVISQAPDSVRKKVDVREFANCVTRAFFNTAEIGNPVLRDLAAHCGNDFRRGYNLFTRYLLHQWVKAKTQEEKESVFFDWFTAETIIKQQTGSVAKQNRLPSFYRGAVNDNLFLNPFLVKQRQGEFLIKIPASKDYAASAIKFNVNTKTNPEINDFDWLVYCAVRQICDSNDPVKDSFGLSQYVIKIAEIVCTIFGVRPDNVMPDDARYEVVLESVEKLINFKMSFDARHFFETRGLVGMSKAKEAQLIVGNIGVSRFNEAGNAREHETLFIYAIHRVFEIYDALGWKNTIPYCKTIFPQNIRSKDVIFLVTAMLSRAAWKGKAAETVSRVPLYEVNDLRTTDGAYSLFKDMEPFGWVDISVLGRGEATREQRNKDATQRRKVEKVLDHWRRSGIFDGVKTNQKTDKDKLLWYEARLNLDALHKHFLTA